MLKTNSKKAIENLKKWIIEHFNPSGYIDPDGDKNDIKDVCKFIYRQFLIEKYYGAEKYYSNMRMQYCFEDWAQGLPSILDTADYYYNNTAINVLGDILEETDEEKARYTQEKAEKLMTSLLFIHISKIAKS